MFPKNIWSLSLAVGAIVSAAVAAEVSPKAPAPPRVLGLSHVAVKATDYEKSVTFYRDFLGFAEQGRLFYPNNGRRELVFLKVSDTQTIEVFDAANVTQVAGQLYQVALNVEDAEAMRVHLARQGFRMPPVVMRGQMKNANFTTRDPNGYILEIVQYLPEGRMVVDRGKFLSEDRISDHIIAAGVTTSKLPETLHCYCNVLGFSESTRGPVGGEGPTWIQLKIPGSADYVEVTVEPKDRTPYFRLEVPDIEVAKSRLEKSPSRAIFKQSLELYVGRDGYRMLNLFDPDGTRIELIEMNKIIGGATRSWPIPNTPRPSAYSRSWR